MNIEELKIGKIYFISFGENTSVVGMIEEIRDFKILFFSHLHYWNGFENYQTKGYCVTAGITEIREASKSEKHSWFKNTLENNDI